MNTVLEWVGEICIYSDGVTVSNLQEQLAAVLKTVPAEYVDGVTLIPDDDGLDVYCTRPQTEEEAQAELARASRDKAKRRQLFLDLKKEFEP